MKILRRIFERPWPNLLLLAGATALLMGNGCSELPREEDGQREPEQARYSVDVSPKNLQLTEQTPSGNVTLLFQGCSGPGLPAGCETAPPNWKVGYNTAITLPKYITISIADPASPTTTATLSVNWDQFRQARPDKPEHSVYSIVFVASGAPPGLWVKGNRVVYLDLYLPFGGGDRTEAPTAEKHLTPIAPQFLEQFKPRKAGVVYKGPSDSLNFSKGGQEPALFSVSYILPSGSPPFSVHDGDTVEVLVEYIGPADSLTHTATLTFSSQNPPPPPAPAAAITFTVTGRQFP